MAEPFIGEVDLYGFNFTPQNWAGCDGQIIAISSNQALFALLGTFYGGDGRSNFALPDLRGKMPVSQGNHPGSQFDWKTGRSHGAETGTLAVTTMATHAHSASFTATDGGTAKVAVSTDVATDNTPAAGSYLAANADLPIYREDAGDSTVDLDGVSGGGGTTSGTVTIGNNGSSKQFNIMQTGLILNYCMAQQGLFPSRN